MEQMMHRAAQYLATAAISFLDKKDDDSHTNLGWNTSLPGLETHALSKEEDKLVLDYGTFSLGWSKMGQVSHKISLNGTSHKEVVEWIESISKNEGITQPYQYSLHYELPYAEITDDFTFSIEGANRLEELTQIRTKVNRVLLGILELKCLSADVRVWPHHFDSGTFAMVNDTLGIGLGMAMPDTMIDDFYLYVSGYHGHEFVDTISFEAMTNGKVYTQGWKGIALPINGLCEGDMNAFYKEALSRYLD
ncbi:MAG: hypothetical protein KTR22_10935 [Flavobacteriaceae bacterium]|nr:hypothetical protein [Flavobacteriaceae bacterium]